MQNHKLHTLRVSQKQWNLILTFEQKVIKKTKMTKKGKITVFGAQAKEFAKIKAHHMANP